MPGQPPADASSPLDQSELRFRLLVESVREYAIFMLDTEGHIVSWNAGAQRLKGYTTEEILGKHFSIFYPPDEVARRKPQRELEIAAAEGQYKEEGWRVRKDGSRFWALVVITALRDRAGNLAGFAKVTRDMTERKQTEERIHRLNEDLQRQVAERTAQLEELQAFSYSVSHDLRAPLRAIDGFSQVVLEDYADRLDDEGRDFLGRIRAASQKLARLLDGLLELSRLSRAEMTPEMVDVSEIARTVADAHLAGAPNRRVRFEIQEGRTAVADPRMVYIVVENLLSNAWKFSARVQEAVIEFGATDEAGERVFYVRDNGAGFDMKHAGKLFGAFNRLHDEREFAGTGIGLATVRRIIQRHGGRIWAASAPGQGATFYFTLPPLEPAKQEES